MNKAIITFPKTLEPGELNNVHKFAMQMALRDFTFETRHGDKIAVEIDGVAYSYDTLYTQASRWTRLKRVEVKRLTDTAILPKRGSLDCAGLDLYADISEPVFLSSGKVEIIATGIALECPAGTYGKIEERSSLGARGVMVRGGIVDRDYRGEVKVMLQYLHHHPDALFTINPGDRIAQIIFHNYIDVEAVEVDELTPTVRDGNGWGSSGK